MWIWRNLGTVLGKKIDYKEISAVAIISFDDVPISSFMVGEEFWRITDTEEHTISQPV